MGFVCTDHDKKYCVCHATKRVSDFFVCKNVNTIMCSWSSSLHRVSPEDIFQLPDSCFCRFRMRAGFYPPKTQSLRHFLLFSSPLWSAESVVAFTLKQTTAEFAHKRIPVLQLKLNQEWGELSYLRNQVHPHRKPVLHQIITKDGSIHEQLWI